MKLGACYNVFDGVELLEFSIDSIRKDVDYINVVYQTVSNYGDELDETDTLNRLIENGKIDKLIFYSPNFRKTPKENETIKRNIGLQDLRANDCTHHMNLDTDEFYFSDELQFAKNLIIEKGYDATICDNIRYYKYPTVQMLYSFNDYAPLIYSVESDLKNSTWKYAVDPSRKNDCKNLYVFKPSEICMHHMWMVRKNMSLKFNNKSSKFNFNANLNKTLEFYTNFEEGDNIKFYRQGKFIESNTKIVPNYFNIKF